MAWPLNAGGLAFCPNPLPFLTELYTRLEKKGKQSALKESKISYSCYKGHKEEVVAAGCCRESWQSSSL